LFRASNICASLGLATLRRFGEQLTGVLAPETLEFALIIGMIPARPTDQTEFAVCLAADIAIQS
jgi:hypothetical protein